MKQIFPDEVENDFLNKTMRFIGFSAQEALMQRDDGVVLAITLCECGTHFNFIEADESDIETAGGGLGDS